MRPITSTEKAPDVLMAEMLALCPAAADALKAAAPIKAQLLPYQAVALYWLAEEYNQDGNRLLDIGVFHGYSTAIMAQAAPRARIIGLNINAHELEVARKHLEPYRNVTLLNDASWDYYPAAPDWFEMVFIDGDHKRAKRDTIWWNKLVYGSLMLWHDYSKEGGPHVVAALNALAEAAHQGIDVKLVDSNGIGMAGLYVQGYIGWPGVRA